MIAMKESDKNIEILLELADVLAKLDHLFSASKDSLERSTINNQLKKTEFLVNKLTIEFIVENKQIDWDKFGGLSFATIGPGFQIEDIIEIWEGDRLNLKEQSELIQAFVEKLV